MSTTAPTRLPLVLYAGETVNHHVRVWSEKALKNLRALGASTIVTVLVQAPATSGDDAWATGGGTVVSATGSTIGTATYSIQLTNPTTIGLAYAQIRVDSRTVFGARIPVERRLS